MTDHRTRRGRARAAFATAALGATLTFAAAACGGGSGGHAAKAAPQTPADKLVAQGLSAQSTGNVDTALHDYQAAVAADPLNKYAYYNMGVIYQQRNDASSAAPAYQKALLIDPKYQPAMFNLAVLETPTNPQAAASMYRQILAINANDANVHFNLALLLKQMGQATDASAELATALKLNPSLSSRVPSTTATTAR